MIWVEGEKPRMRSDAEFLLCAMCRNDEAIECAQTGCKAEILPMPQMMAENRYCGVHQGMVGRMSYEFEHQGQEPQ